MSMMTPFTVPDEVIIEPKSGYAVNIPLAYQGYPGWWDDNPTAVANIQVIRQQRGITINDFPDGIPTSFQDALAGASSKRVIKNADNQPDGS